MANLYGVANPIALPAQANTIGAADVNCPAGTETNVIAIPTNVPISQGWYYPAVFAVLAISLGATPPTGVQLGARIGAGADFSYWAIYPGMLAASITLEQSFQLFGAGTILAYSTGPLTINISVNPTAQAVTARFSGSYAYAWWNRAPDQ